MMAKNIIVPIMVIIITMLIKEITVTIAAGGKVIYDFDSNKNKKLNLLY